MNSFLISLSPIQDIYIKEEVYGKKIYQALNDIFPDIHGVFRVSSFFGYFFENEFMLEKEKSYKIMMTIKAPEYFPSLIQKLFRKALNKETIIIGENEFIIKGIVSSDKTWTGHYNFKNIMEQETEDLKDNLKIKILTPILSEKKIENKFVFGFDEIFFEILSNFEKYSSENFNYLKNEKNEIFLVKQEKYYTKKIIIENVLKNSYLGEIDIFIQENEYKNLIHSIFQFSRFNGIGKMAEYGFGQILLL
ncbi:hypothetical protein EII29_04220 [Leptotrichia sp. OH3620_COT-345]|uniref:hypothetical protein n=1 Tax=Leptotrichia sp. OH3620_COT-345 TaxID=2491048 RepID=UPI000F650914|nr:hypothetical protein [Leptotrichia sp. OH3620_COT-345]RRD40021.1 hypothetical protein EII29_04220 [Leptotrichia sp. OH3620_COT-345]